MEKKEKKSDLEQLLNSLIKQGWKPRGLNIMGKIVIDYDIEFAFDIYDSLQKGHWNFRELVSKESGLWQFVCKNKLLKHGVYTGAKWQRRKKYDNYWNTDIQVYKPEYRLIESALCDEDKLEEFILDNVKIGDI